MKYKKFATKAVHAGQEPDPTTGSVVTPIYASSTFVFESAEQGADRFLGKQPGYIYTRLGNPTVRALELNVAALEGGEDARAAATGMAAITGVVMSVVKSGDHIVAGDRLYGGTHKLVTDILKEYGIEHTLVDTMDPANFEKAIQPNTKMIYIETPSNPLMSLTDIKAVGKIGKKHGIVTVIDNTFMSPYLQRPIEMGIDVVVHSLTKSLSGHSDMVGGIVVSTKEFIKQMDPTFKNMGATMGAWDAWLTLRGIKTLHVRWDRTVENAQKIDRQNTPAHRPGRCQRQITDLHRQGTGQSFPAASRVGDPVVRAAIHGIQNLVPHHHGADVPAGLFYILLDVEHLVCGTSQSGPVEQDRLGRFAVVDPAEQPPP